VTKETYLGIQKTRRCTRRVVEQIRRFEGLWIRMEAIEGLPRTRWELGTIKGMTKEHIPTLFSQTMYFVWNARGKEMVDPHRWFMNYLDCKLDAKGNNPRLKTLIKVFCKVCEDNLEIKRPLIRRERMWLSLTFKNQVTK
jgi:hypothetical protein